MSIISTCFAKKAFTPLEALGLFAITGIIFAIIIPTAFWAIDASKERRARQDLMELTSAIKKYQTTYGKLPTTVVSYDDGPEAAQGWFQDNNDDVIRVLTGENVDGLNPRKIVFLETRPAKGGEHPKDGVAADGKFYDPWGTPYAIKMDTSYNNALEYYGVNYENNCRTTVIAVSFGKNKIQQDPGKSTDKGERVDDVVSFQ